MNKKYIRITVIAMLCAMALIATDIILKYQHLERKSHEISEGFSYTYTPERIMMGMKSKTDTFKVDDVTFDIYYGMYEEGDENPKSYYIHEEETVFFLLYLYAEDKNSDITDGILYKNYRNTDKIQLVKEIAYEEAFLGDYTYKMSKKNGIEYKHRETVTIKEELFDKDKGSISIELVALVPLENGEYMLSNISGINIIYEFISEDTVKIEYRHIK